MREPEISIVIVSLNTREYLRRCLTAIPGAASDLTVEVLVVDNGSTDGTQGMLAEEFPGVRVVQSGENLGFGKASNLGARNARGRALLLLNSDCEMQPGALRTMLRTLDGDAGVGGILCRLLNADGSLQPSVHPNFPTPWSLLGDVAFLTSLRYAIYRRPALHRLFLRRSMAFHGSARDVAWGGAACLLIRRESFLGIGGFDERFFLFCEDMDLCKRLGEAGVRLCYTPEAWAIHHWGRSTAQQSAASRRAAYQSRILYYDKHFPGWGGPLARCLGEAELRLRGLILGLLACLPLPQAQALRSRAEASMSLLHDLRDSQPRLDDRRSARRSSAALAIAIVLLFCLFRYGHDSLKVLLASPFIDFAHYYTYATVVAQGKNPFDPVAVARADATLNIRRAGAAANYPPVFYLLMRPWVLIPIRPAAVLWFLASQACLAATMALCLRRVPGPSPLRVTALLFVVLNYQPLLENLFLGQANAFLLLLVTVAWRALRTGRPWAASIAVAATALIKIQYVFLFPFLWWTGRSRVAARAFLLWGFALGIGIPVLGQPHYAAYLQYLLSPPGYLHAWTANLSLRATLYRLFTDSSHGAVLANGLTAILSLALLLGLAWLTSRPTPSDSTAADWTWGLGLTVLWLLSPFMLEHHLVVLLLPLSLLLLTEPDSPPSGAEQAMLVATILLLASQYSLERFPIFRDGIPSLLTTGKLLGVVGLAWILARRLRTARRSGEAP
jgi:hypothetical protein